ncbi:flagellar biosynthetic protein FliR [Sphingomonas sp. So64.6b]|uniref:flagellar biosynthetic protein FliR n=1 Tax=Sphingomonas sp. So64.6b TaxID=2997354 RepID=UPI001602C7E6|nr:flagellar biosynthetic protein FliR [Sphingomonas sp. So64.6b]QNA82946.1 flagellar biosynthetic protein FliR [Sphingomonas sp. So64.6b]
MGELTDKAVAILLISLRIAPTLAFTAPFTLLRVPATVRVLLSISLAAWLVSAHPAQSWQVDFWSQGLFITALGELLLGIALSLSLQLAFAALLTAGRALDIQAGFGLAVLVDPTTRSSMPLVGTIFAYAAGMIFFSTEGPADLLAIWSASLDSVPLGGAAIGGDIAVLSTYISGVFVMAFGLGGLIMLALFLSDLVIAFMSRTLPQMNVMLLGFQVKAMVLLATLPFAITLATSLFLRMLRYALETAPRLI